MDAVKQIDEGARVVLDRSDKLVTIGGDHTIALPLLRVMHELHGPIAVVHFDAHLDTWDTYFGAPVTHGTPFRRASEEGLIDKTGSMHVGIRGPLYSRQDLTDDAVLGFQVIGAHDMDDLGWRGAVEQIKRAGRRPTDVRLARHRRPRPVVRAGHRHPGGRRADQPRAAATSCAASPSSTWSAPTSSRSPRPTTTPRSPASRPPTRRTS